MDDPGFASMFGMVAALVVPLGLAGKGIQFLRAMVRSFGEVA